MTAIIIDGPDRCFKTTTIKLFKKELTLRGKHIPSYKASDFSNLFTEQVENKSELFKNRLRFCTTTEVDMLKQLDFDVIFDRHYPSEYVYSSYYNRVTDESLLKQVDKDLAAYGAKIFLLRRTSYTGWVDNLDDSIILEKIDQLYNDFAKWSSNKQIHHIFVDTMTESERIQHIYDLTFKNY